MNGQTETQTNEDLYLISTETGPVRMHLTHVINGEGVRLADFWNIVSEGDVVELGGRDRPTDDVRRGRTVEVTRDEVEGWRRTRILVEGESPGELTCLSRRGI